MTDPQSAGAASRWRSKHMPLVAFGCGLMAFILGAVGDALESVRIKAPFVFLCPIALLLGAAALGLAGLGVYSIARRRTRGRRWVQVLLIVPALFTGGLVCFAAPIGDRWHRRWKRAVGKLWESEKEADLPYDIRYFKPTGNPEADRHCLEGLSLELEKKNHDYAIAEYAAAISLKPDYVLAYRHRARCYRAKDDHEKALADWSHLAEMDPTSVIFLSEMAKSLGCR